MSAQLKIGLRLVGEDQPTFVIAEIGQNHQGDLNTAKELMKVAKNVVLQYPALFKKWDVAFKSINKKNNCWQIVAETVGVSSQQAKSHFKAVKRYGADCVKFQKTCIPEKFNKAALNRPYSGDNSWAPTYGLHKSFLEFSEENFCELQNYANEIDIMFTASAMDQKSLRFLISIKVPFIKIGSGDNNNLLMIEEAAAAEIPLIISTGMQNFNDVQTIYKCVSKYHKNFALLHCVSAYPTLTSDMNLNVIKLYKEEFPDVVVGYSGHEQGTDAVIAAVTLGAKIIERHITLDKSQKGSDHKCSLEPNELEEMVKKIRYTESILGRSAKVIQNSELPCYLKLRKTIVASKAIKRGHVLELEDLKIKVAEPKGLDACQIYSIVRKCVKRDIDEDESITANCLE